VSSGSCNAMHAGILLNLVKSFTIPNMTITAFKNATTSLAYTCELLIALKLID